jgi:hypothetical protein
LSRVDRHTGRRRRVKRRDRYVTGITLAVDGGIEVGIPQSNSAVIAVPVPA